MKTKLFLSTVLVVACALGIAINAGESMAASDLVTENEIFRSENLAGASNSFHATVQAQVGESLALTQPVALGCLTDLNTIEPSESACYSTALAHCGPIFCYEYERYQLWPPEGVCSFSCEPNF